MKQHRTIAEQHANRCVYFNGVAHEKCDANIKYPNINHLPCFLDRVLDGIPECEKRHFPTAEEVKQFVKEHERHFDNMKKSFQLVAKIKKEHKGENWSGVEICPACGGKLHLTHAAFNGHVWGKCETEKCLAWLE